MPGRAPLNYLAWEHSPEQQMIQGVVREFVEQEAQPLIPDCFERGEFPRQLVPRLAELGVLGPTIPKYGSGLDYTSYGLICQELERGDSGLRSFISVQGSLVMFPISTYGSEEQKERYLPKMHRGELIGCFGLTEHEHGSDPGGMETRALRDGDCFVLNGAKMWITNGNLADVALIWAKVDEDGQDVVRGFLVETDTSGFTANEVKHKLSLRASVTSELVLQDVRVPASAMLPGARGLRGPLSCLNEARYGIVWGSVGAGRACFEAALEYAKERRVFGKPIAGYQLTQQKLAEMALELNRASLVALHLGRMKDAGTLRPEHVSLGKMGNVRGALEVARSARTILGGNGITLEYPVIRHMNNLESVLTYEGTHEVHTLVVGNTLTGENAFR
jgi:glutaryl-CoA dehydrogenase